MMHLLKKNIIVLFLIVLTSLLSGCSAMGEKNEAGSINGISFEYYESFNYNNSQYDIYSFDISYLDYLSDIVYYRYIEYSFEDIKDWTINYFETYEYYILNNNLCLEELELFTNSINNLLEVYEDKLNIEFDIYNYNTIIEKQFTVYDINQYQSVLLVDMFIPFRLMNKNSWESYIIYIPVKTFVAYRNDNSLVMKIDDNVIKTYYDEFIN